MEQAARSRPTTVLGGGTRAPEGVLEDVLDALRGGCGGVGPVAGCGGGRDAVGRQVRVGGTTPRGQGGVAVGEGGGGAVVVVGVVGAAAHPGDVVLDPDGLVDGPPLGGLDDGPGGGAASVEGTAAIAVGVGIGVTSSPIAARGAISGRRIVTGDGSLGLGLEPAVERVGVAAGGGVVSSLVVVGVVGLAAVLPVEGRHVRGGGRTRLLDGGRLGVRRVRRSGSSSSTSGGSGNEGGLLGAADVGLLIPRRGVVVGGGGAQLLQLLRGQVGGISVQVVVLVVDVGGVVDHLTVRGGGVGTVVAISTTIASSSAIAGRGGLGRLEGALLAIRLRAIDAAVRLGGLAALGVGGTGRAGMAASEGAAAGPLLLAGCSSGDGSRFHVRCGLHLAGFATGPGRTDWDVGRRSRGEDGATDQNGGGVGYLHGLQLVVVGGAVSNLWIGLAR